jgi:Rrf2 family protein
MHISAVEEYGIRCALQLATLENGAVLAASQIAEREGISVQYASKIMHLFRKAGLVSASRGMQGGFRLVRAPDAISLKAVFNSLREEKTVGFCRQYTGLQTECVHLKDCSVRPVWHVLASYFEAVLEQVSLADLVRSESDAQQRVQEFARLEAERVKQRITGSGSRATNLDTRLEKNGEQRSTK